MTTDTGIGPPHRLGAMNWGAMNCLAPAISGGAHFGCDPGLGPSSAPRRSRCCRGRRAPSSSSNFARSRRPSAARRARLPLPSCSAGPGAATVEQAAAKAIPSVVKLETATDSRTVEGSGVVLSADGLVLTNTHVVSTPGLGPAALVLDDRDFRRRTHCAV